MASDAASMPAVASSKSRQSILGTARGRMVVAGLVALVTLIAAYFLVFAPQGAKIKDARAATEAAEATKAELTTELKRLRGLQANAPQLRETAGKLDKALPADVQLAEFILLVQDAANASRIDWVTTNPVPPTAAVGGPAGLQEIAVTMTAEGGYFEVHDFLVKLEELARAVKVGSIDLTTKGSDPTAAPRLTANLAAKIYVAGAVQPGAAAPGGAAPVGGPATGTPAGPAAGTPAGPAPTQPRS